MLLLTVVAVVGALSGNDRLQDDRHLPQASLQIRNLQANASTVGLYEKLELTFDITGTVATNPYFPYDP
ncbi:MAG: hypothetical protein N0A03_09980, partial [Anaerolineae bacterium]|nr:hypothetical protein [Anaerolineae bacterium]